MFWKSIVLIIVLAIVGGCFGGIIAKKKQHTTYTASRNVFITHNLNTYSLPDNNPQDSTILNDQNMMESYKQIVEDPQITNAAQKMLPKKLQKEISPDEFNERIKAKGKPQSLVLTVQAESGSPTKAVKMANATADALKKQLPKIQPGVGEIVLLAKANRKTVTSITTPHAKKYAAVGIALGGALGLVISFTILTLKDISKRY